jgi:hypothetical protein
MEVMPGLRLTFTQRLAAVVVGIAMTGCAWGLVLVAQTSTPQSAAAPHNVVPHLVPDGDGLHAGSPGTTAAPKANAQQPAIRLIPSAGGPVTAFGGAPGGTTGVPGQQHHS